MPGDPEGLYFYNSRWYDPRITHFIQPDNIIPDSGDPQSWDRFAYTRNNPVNRIDPTGHKDCEEDGYCHQEEPVKGWWKKPESDYRSFTLTVGLGPFFYVSGIDVVVNDDQIGWFSVESKGPGLGGNTASVVSTEAEDNTWVTPQIGISYVNGNVYSKKVHDDVEAYEGTAKVGGMSAGPATAEYFASVNPMAGEVDYKTEGIASGVTVGPVPIEGHVYYTEAVYDAKISGILTRIGKMLGSFDLPFSP